MGFDFVLLLLFCFNPSKAKSKQSTARSEELRNQQYLGICAGQENTISISSYFADLKFLEDSCGKDGNEKMCIFDVQVSDVKSS